LERNDLGKLRHGLEPAAPAVCVAWVVNLIARLAPSAISENMGVAALAAD